MTLREATAQAISLLNRLTVTGQDNINKLANAFTLLDAVESKLAALEEGENKDGGV